MAEIILTDDDPLIIDLFQEALELAGHRVSVGFSAIEARTLFSQHMTQGKKIDVLISDNTMPGETGSDMIRDLAREFKNTKYILVSGTKPADWDRTGIPYLDKPVTPTELVAKVAEVLGLHS
ncbi:MAG: response regulator [Alphaproteobacteria bacterium]